MKKQFFASASTFTLIAALFTEVCERTNNTDDMPQPTPEPVEIPADITPVAPDTLSTFTQDSIKKADSLAMVKSADSLKATAAKDKTAASVQSKKTTKKSATTTKTTTATGGPTSTSKKGTGTTTGGAETSTQKKGSGTTTGGSGTSTPTQKKGTNPKFKNTRIFKTIF